MIALRFLLRRVLQGVVVLWIVTSATFVLIHLAPGGPAILAKFWISEFTVIALTSVSSVVMS